MTDSLYLELQRHLTQLDYIKLFSLYVQGLVENDELDQIDECMENRGRLINLTTETQQRIELAIKNLSGAQAQEFAPLLKCWSADTLSSIKEIEQIDQSISFRLHELKQETTKQISHLFKARESFKGYNLTTTKR